MVRRALRLAAGTASLAAGTWLLRALHGNAGRARCRRGVDQGCVGAIAELS